MGIFFKIEGIMSSIKCADPEMEKISHTCGCGSVLTYLKKHTNGIINQHLITNKHIEWAFYDMIRCKQMKTIEKEMEDEYLELTNKLKSDYEAKEKSLNDKQMKLDESLKELEKKELAFEAKNKDKPATIQPYKYVPPPKQLSSMHIQYKKLFENMFGKDIIRFVAPHEQYFSEFSLIRAYYNDCYEKMIIDKRDTIIDFTISYPSIIRNKHGQKETEINHRYFIYLNNDGNPTKVTGRAANNIYNLIQYYDEDYEEIK